MTTTYGNVSNASALSADITAIDLASQAGGGTGTHYVITLKAGATLTEGSDVTAIDLAGSDTLTLNGEGAELNGADDYRGLFVYAGKVTIENLTIEDAVAKGGAGGGGALFVADDESDGAYGNSPQVTLDNIDFASDSAVGGTGGIRGAGSAGGGGGGLGGPGGNAFQSAGGGVAAAGVGRAAPLTAATAVATTAAQGLFRAARQAALDP